MTHCPKWIATALASVAVAALLSACSQEVSENEAAPTDASAQEAAADNSATEPTAIGPRVDRQLASGVAFTYDMAFRIADDQISAAQDAHIDACAELGRNQCRVADVRYERKQDGPIEASLTFMVDPALTRAFARNAVSIVEGLDGTLDSSNINGVDVGTGIDQSQRLSADLGGDLERLEQRLRSPGLSARERTEIEAQLGRLRGDLRSEEQGRRQSESRLAATPVHFDYHGTIGAAGINYDRPFSSAFAASTESFASAAAFVLLLLGIMLPWALMLGGAILIWRVIRRRFVTTPAANEPGASIA